MDTWKLEKIKAYFMLTNETVFWLEHVVAWSTLSFVKGPEIGEKVASFGYHSFCKLYIFVFLN